MQADGSPYYCPPLDRSQVLITAMAAKLDHSMVLRVGKILNILLFFEYWFLIWHRRKDIFPVDTSRSFDDI